MRSKKRQAGVKLGDNQKFSKHSPVIKELYCRKYYFYRR